MSDECRIDILGNRIEALEDAIRKHRDSWLNGDDKCWKDNEVLYELLPEGFTPPERDELCELANCQKYIRSCHHPEVNYVSPQRWIEVLETTIKRQDDRINSLQSFYGRYTFFMALGYVAIIAIIVLRGL